MTVIWVLTLDLDSFWIPFGFPAFPEPFISGFSKSYWATSLKIGESTVLHRGNQVYTDIKNGIPDSRQCQSDTKFLEFPVEQFGDGSPLPTLGNILQPVSQVEDDKETFQINFTDIYPILS